MSELCEELTQALQPAARAFLFVRVASKINGTSSTLARVQIIKPLTSCEGLVPRTGLLHDPGTPTRGLLIAFACRPWRPQAFSFARQQAMNIGLPTTLARVQIKKPLCFAERLCAQDWIRTSTPFPAPPPQGGLSTNFNTWAPNRARFGNASADGVQIYCNNSLAPKGVFSGNFSNHLS